MRRIPLYSPPAMEADRPAPASAPHHIYRLTRLAASLDPQARHVEADRIDRIVRRARTVL